MTLADQIRQHAREHMVAPCRTAGVREFAIRAGDLHRDMGLSSRLPAVCGALRSRKFQELSGIELLRVEGPYNGASTTFHFGIERTESSHQATPAELLQSAAGAELEPEPVRQAAGDPADRIVLVACVSSKQDAPAPARDLYTSAWFRKARAYAEAARSSWFILSAEYGLVHPDTVIAPYERTLNRMSMRERRDWAKRVREQMEEVLPDADEVVLLAGERYRELLMEYLRSRARRVSVPMEGMRIGEQLGWLSRVGAGGPPVRSQDAEHDATRAAPLARITDRLLDLNGRIDRAVFFPTVEQDAAEFVLCDAYAFLFAICLDRGTKSEII